LVLSRLSIHPAPRYEQEEEDRDLPEMRARTGMESTEEVMNRSDYRVEAAYHQRLCFYLVYVIRMDDYKTIVKRVYSKKEVVGIATTSLRKLGYNGRVTPKDVTWRFIGESKKSEKKITDIAPSSVEVLDAPESKESEMEEELQGISEEQLESGGLT
jgi:hypothetical protein